jgi:hypothetical protein
MVSEPLTDGQGAPGIGDHHISICWSFECGHWSFQRLAPQAANLASGREFPLHFPGITKAGLSFARRLNRVHLVNPEASDASYP